MTDGSERGAAGAGLAAAAARVEAYERAAGASLAYGEGEAATPVERLTEAQLAALFAPRMLEALVARPLTAGREPKGGRTGAD